MDVFARILRQSRAKQTKTENIKSMCDVSTDPDIIGGASQKGNKNGQPEARNLSKPYTSTWSETTRNTKQKKQT